MPFVAACPLADGETVEIFAEPDAREWRELEAAVDPLDGVRAFLVGGRLYAWLPAALHEQVEPLLRQHLGAAAAASGWLPVSIVPALHLVIVTTSLIAGGDQQALRQQIERQIRANAALQRRFRGELTVQHAWRLREAA
jgi:fructose-1,6-bisphosphatase/inositol monophosphatase family enzyme